LDLVAFSTFTLSDSDQYMGSPLRGTHGANLHNTLEATLRFSLLEVIHDSLDDIRFPTAGHSRHTEFIVSEYSGRILAISGRVDGVAKAFGFIVGTWIEDVLEAKSTPKSTIYLEESCYSVQHHSLPSDIGIRKTEMLHGLFAVQNKAAKIVVVSNGRSAARQEVLHGGIGDLFRESN
jgi:hypothetical protein